MLREVTLECALHSYINGEDVKVILPMEDGEDRLVSVERMFNEARFLVDKKFTKLNPEVEETIQEVIETTAAPKKEVKKPKLELDMGKVIALRNAGWSVKKIADEMRCSEPTIWNRLKELKEQEEDDNNERRCNTELSEL